MATFSKLSTQVKIATPISALVILLFILRRVTRRKRSPIDAKRGKKIIVDK